MNGLTLGLVLASAVLHATWNYLAKRVGGGMAVVWLFSTLSALIYLPLVLGMMLVQRPNLDSNVWLFLLGSAALHIVYYFLLQRGYSVGDLSLVYPLARGSGPVLSVIGAILMLGERPSPGALAGALLVSIGVFVVMGSWSSVRSSGAAIAYGLTCGLSIAAYTLWDKQAVSALLIPPILLTWMGNAVQAIVLIPNALCFRGVIASAWQNHRRAIIGIGIMDSLSYILFLIALSMSQVSLLAPLRQTSILIGAFMGVRLLSEGASRRRLVAAGVMLVGLMALTLG